MGLFIAGAMTSTLVKEAELLLGTLNLPKVSLEKFVNVG